jgi:hypothetical protein
MAFSLDQMKSLITAHKGTAQKEAREFEVYRRSYLSEHYSTAQRDDDQVPLEDQDPTSEVNFLFPHVDQMVASVVPTNPMVFVRPKREVKYEAARAREALINDCFRRQEMHRKCWGLARRASIFRQSYLKATWDGRYRAARFRVLTPKNVWFDPNAEDWDDVRYVIEMMVVPAEDFRKRVKKRGPGNEGASYTSTTSKKVAPEVYPAWLKGDPDKDDKGMEEARAVLEYYVVYEFWDLSDEKARFYHIHMEADKPLFAGDQPYRWLRNPYRPLSFIDNLEDARGVSDAKLVYPSLEQLNNVDSLELQHSLRSIPITYIDASKIQNVDEMIDAQQSVDSAGALVSVNMTDNGTALSSAMYTPQAASLTPNFASARNKLENNAQRILALSSYSRGEVGHATVATEAALADASTRTRAGFRQKEVFDVVAWAARATISLYSEFLDPKESISARLIDSDQYLTLDREVLGLPIAQSDPDGVEYFTDSEGNTIAPEDDELSYDYDVAVYSPAEATKLSKLKSIMEAFPMLQQMMAAGVIDSDKFASRVLDLLDIRDVKAPKAMGPQGAADMTAAGAAMQAGNGPAGIPAVPDPSQDTAAGGALPQGLEVPNQSTALGGAGHRAPNSIPAGSPNLGAMKGGLS